MVYNTDKLKARIVEKYGNQKAFAEALGTNESTISRYMAGREWKASTMMRAAELLEIPADEIEAYFFDYAVAK